jgi:ATP-binding cassette subfamily F protein 3
MSIARFEKVTKTFEPHLILDAITWQIAADDRIGLIGANGTGKTTCLEILAGIQAPTTGQVFRAKGLRIGYMSQRPNLTAEMTLRNAMLDVFAEQRRLEDRLHTLSEAMSDERDESALEALLDQYDRLEHLHATQGGYSYEFRIDSILGGLGFSPDEFDKPVGVLSGGETNRAALAKLLLDEPALLLLDEPTNHLDIRAVEWLESYLNVEYKGAFVVVSHDRFFLDKVTRKTAELRNHRLTEYRGNYSQYLKTRERNELSREREYEKQQDYIARTEDYIRRNIAGQNTRQAQGRRKILSRMERIEAPDDSLPKMKLRFESEDRSGNVVIVANDLTMDYGRGPVFRNLTFDVMRRDALGIMGPNGAGKTTLFRLILGEEKATGGELRLGASLKIGSLSQEPTGFRRDRSVMQEIWAEMPAATQGEVRGILARFLFRGDDVDKSVGNLSGGELSRLALCRILLRRPNLLLLDEPTNHLDIPSREALEDALLDFDGTIVLISHDRYLLAKLATKLLIFEDEGVRFWRYSYAEWERFRAERDRKEREDAKTASKPKAVESAKSAPKPSKPKTGKTADAKRRR